MTRNEDWPLRKKIAKEINAKDEDEGRDVMMEEERKIKKKRRTKKK
jgi:hypothetical protein